MIKRYLKIVNQIIQKNKILVLILVLAVCLRFVGVYPGYNQYHADETLAYTGAVSIIKTNSLYTGWYFYGTIPAITNAAFYKTFFIPLSWARYYSQNITNLIDGKVQFPPSREEAQRIFDTYIIGDSSRNTIFWSRYITAFFGVGTVLLTYLLGRKLFNGNVGLIAAFLLVFNFKHVVNSHLALPDIYNSFFLLLSMLTILRLFEKQSLKNYILAGIAAGVSFSVKYQVYAILPLALTHLLVSLPNTKLLFSSENKFANLTEALKIFIKKLFRPSIFITVLLIPLTFAALNPFYIINFEEAWAQNILDVKRYALGVNQLNLYPLWYMYHFDYGAPQLVLFVIGLVWVVFKEFKKSLILLGPIALFFYMFFYYSTGGFFVRNIITTTPLLLILVAYAVWQIYLKVTKVSAKLVANILLIIFLILVIYVPAKNSVISSYNYTKPWNYQLMGEWLKANLPNDAIVASDPWDILPYGPLMKKTEFGVTKSYSLAEHQENGATWALISSHWSPGHFYNWMNFGFAQFGDNWGKPIDHLRNTYYGIAAEEIFRYQVYAVTKPWQASDPNMIIAKLPVWPAVEMETVKNFYFDRDLEGWKVVSKAAADSVDYVYDADVGNEHQGSVRYVPGGGPTTVARIVSPLIEIKPGHLYKISGDIKTERNLIGSEREGYIRVDFYEEEPELDQRGIVTSVSGRVFGTTDWVEKHIVERAPETAKYLVISFSNSRLAQPIIWLDEVKVEESTEPVNDITAKPPYNKRPIDLDPFYPNSHGNL